MNGSTDKNTKTSKHKNVMLLAMSTLPHQPKVNTYQIEENGKVQYFKSLSQMEPHTKYVLHMLACKGEKLDRIVILESLKARTEKPQNWNNETATTLFTKRIYNYMGGNEKVDITVPDELENLHETPCNPDIYIETFPEIITVDLDNPVFFWETVKAIRGAEKDEIISLYMDMQGGDRNAVSQMNAIAELLIRQNVVIMGRFANDFEPKRTSPLHTIRDAGREYRTYDLISAMDIFARYGWGDKLEEYFRGEGNGGSKEEKLVSAIKEASLAISTCSGDKFDNAVRKIENLEKEFESPETVTEMDVVYQDIYETYKPLLGAEYRYVAQIRWCLDRHFLQQALTIFEAKMPGEFVRSGLLYYPVADKDREKFFEIFENNYCDKKHFPKQKHYQMKDLNHYLIKDYCYNYHKRRFQNKKNLLTTGLGTGRMSEVISLLDTYRKLCGLRNQLNHAAEGRHNPEGFFCYMKARHPHDPNWFDEKEKVDYEKKLRDYLDNWKALADQVPDEIKKQAVDLS